MVDSIFIQALILLSKLKYNQVKGTKSLKISNRLHINFKIN